VALEEGAKGGRLLCPGRQFGRVAHYDTPCLQSAPTVGRREVVERLACTNERPVGDEFAGMVLEDHASPPRKAVSDGMEGAAAVDGTMNVVAASRWSVTRDGRRRSKCSRQPP
jgi:hypothetical protein